ncbi:MAG: response regulator transcription factor [Spirochaetaceae bacterium]|jgi:two-component system phosphate regulon response regulator PhoB|nr:response regulator transcription factor [Spirochaetaceae bacterium]
MYRAAILIVEDDEEIQELLTLAMGREGWRLVMAKNGETALTLLKRESVDCVILDIMLPGMDGFTVLKKLKAERSLGAIPVIMTTARGEDADIVAGLELGADDYVVKPYSPRVLIARVRAALRRKEGNALPEAERTLLREGRLSLDVLKHEALLDDAPLDLSVTEFSLLNTFLSQPGRVFSRNQIINEIHGTDYPVTDRSVDVQVMSLRKKLKDAGNLIETIRGVGYRLKTA